MTHERILEGEALFSAGKLNEAEESFLLALKENPREPVALNNLGVIAYKRQEYDKARDLFKQALAMDPLYVSARENLSELPKAALGTPFLVRGRRITVLSEGDADFSRLCLAYFGNNNKVREVRSLSDGEAAALAGGADIVIAASLNPALSALLLHKGALRVIARVKGTERLFAPAFPWNTLDGVIFPAVHVRAAAELMAGPGVRLPESGILPDGLDMNFYPVYKNGPGRNVCFFGNANAAHGISFLVQCIAQAVARGEQFRFHIAGEFEDPRYGTYLMHLLKELDLGRYVTFYGKFKEPVTFLRDMNFVVNTSEHEGMPSELVKAMACGIRPLVRAWQGAAALFPEKDLFRTPGEFAALLMDGAYRPVEIREWAAVHFNAVQAAPRVDEFVHRVTTRA
ncbi:MAG: tetratricopeptide repeat protein [Fibrobacterota bacterium]